MSLTELARWVVAGVLAAGGATLVVLNGWIVFNWWRTRRHISLFPFIGGMAVAVGLGVAPFPFGAWALLPMAVDPGGFWLLATTLLAWRARCAAARGGNAAQSEPVAPPRPAARPTFR